MAEDYQIITDSSCDLPQELVDALELRIVPLNVTINGKTCRNYPDGREIGFREFYEALASGQTASTSAPSPARYLEEMEPVLQAGRDILCISFSSALSSTHQSACIAAQELRERYPERTILTIDSLCASLGQGLFVWLAAKWRQEGAPLQAVYDRLLEVRPRLCHWFMVNDLMHLKRGGRVGAAAAMVGTMLQVKPVMHMNQEGKLESVTKVRGRRAALSMLADRVCSMAVEPEKQTMFLCHGNCPEEAQALAAELQKRCGVPEVIVNYVGPVIGAHTGPGVISVFFLGTER